MARYKGPHRNRSYYTDDPARLREQKTLFGYPEIGIHNLLCTSTLDGVPCAPTCEYWKAGPGMEEQAHVIGGGQFDTCLRVCAFERYRRK